MSNTPERFSCKKAAPFLAAPLLAAPFLAASLFSSALFGSTPFGSKFKERQQAIKWAPEVVIDSKTENNILRTNGRIELKFCVYA